MGLDLLVLGPLEVRRDGRPVPITSAKERTLLCALVLSAGRVLSTDRLLEVLWGAEPPASAANTLQTYVSHLRRALDPDRTARARDGVLRTSGPGYLLSVEPEVVDAVRFERLAARGRAALADDPAAALDHLGDALALWRGDALVDVAVEPFAQSEITRLTELRMAAYGDWVDARLALGHAGDLVPELTRATAEHPLRERLWGQLVRALYASGRAAEAVAAFARVRETLAEQLGVDPGPELTRLHTAVLTGSDELARPVPEPVPPVPAQRTGARHADPELPDVGGAADPLRAGRAALARYDWARAAELLAAADAESALSGDDLVGLAEAVFWLGDSQASFSLRQRAHQAFTDVGLPRRAALVAVRLAILAAWQQRRSVAQGWYHRAERLLAEGGDGPERGYLCWAAALTAIADGDSRTAAAAAGSTAEAGRRFGIDELLAVGLVLGGYVAVRGGDVDAGMAQVDEAMAMAVSGGLPPFAAATVFCRTVELCYDLGDFRRAEEWSDAIADAFERTGLTAFPGDCEAHRVDCLVGRGAWEHAERMARQACTDMDRFDMVHVGVAFRAVGDIRLRKGDLPSAARAFDRAESLGVPPLPGRARLELARGRPGAANGLLSEALAAERADRLARSKLLPDQVTAALAAGDVGTARAAARELRDIADAFPAPAMAAAADAADGAIALATGEGDPLAPLRRSVATWARAGETYEGCRTRLLLATALRRAGRPEAAAAEEAAARRCLQRLGARPDGPALALPTAS